MSAPAFQLRLLRDDVASNIHFSSRLTRTVTDEVVEADAAESVQVGHTRGVHVTLGGLIIAADAGPTRVAVSGESLTTRRCHTTDRVVVSYKHAEK